MTARVVKARRPVRLAGVCVLVVGAFLVAVEPLAGLALVAGDEWLSETGGE